jgi:phytoene desaturase
MSKKITILGAGVSGLSCAAFLAKQGNKVTILEKNTTIGGRGRHFNEQGFLFDLGPSWYWMPEIFENFYQKFGHTTSDFYELKRLEPSYRIFWKDESFDDVPANLDEFYAWFESMEKGSSVALKKFLKDAKIKYEIGMGEFVYKPSLSWFEFVNMKILKGAVKLDLTKSFATYIRKYFKHPKILSVLEFPVLFLGATPKATPALYSLMNYADISLGTWYPMGGMGKVFEAFEKIALEQGVEIKVKHEVTNFTFSDKKIISSNTNDATFENEIVVSSADYHHTEHVLLKDYSNYSEKYWDKRKLAPSCLMFYIGVDKKLDNLLHHNLFFDEDFDQHAIDIYENPSWPKSPLFYVSCSSKTDPSTAPIGKENLVLLIPIAPDLKDSEEIRNKYLEIMLNRIEKLTKSKFKDSISYCRSYCISDFKKDYHAFKGNAYGLANTLMQTAVLKPKIKNKNLKNMYYTGQLTVPGPGVPPCIISGELVALEIQKQIQKQKL